MATTETATGPDTIPGTLALTAVRRPGFRIFDADVIIGPDSRDLFYESAVEVSGRSHSTFLETAGDDLEHRHSFFAADASDFSFQRLGATNVILSRLTDAIRTMAHDPELMTDSGSDTPVPHSGLTNWTPGRIELDRYSFRSGQEPSLSQIYRSGDQVGSFVTALVMLHGSRQVDVARFNGRNIGRWSPLLSRAQVMLLRGTDLIEDQAEATPEYRFGKIYPSTNNLLMTVMNQTVEPPIESKPSFP
jgi:hypothetical protein